MLGPWLRGVRGGLAGGTGVGGLRGRARVVDGREVVDELGRQASGGEEDVVAGWRRISLGIYFFGSFWAVCWHGLRGEAGKWERKGKDLRGWAGKGLGWSYT